MLGVGAKRVGHPAHEPTDRPWVVDHIVAIDDDTSRRRLVERGHDSHRGRLTRTVGADEAYDPTAGNREREIADGMDSVEHAVEAGDLDERFG